MDFFNYTSDLAGRPVPVTIKHPVTGADTNVVISVVGLDSPAAQACLDSQQARRFNALADNPEQAKVNVFDPEAARADLVELLVACTVEWKNLEWQGDALEFNPGNAAFIYQKVPAIREQLNRFVGNRKNFFKD